MLTRHDILAWLREPRESRLQDLWRQADAVRRATVGDAVHLRGLVEFSNHCVRACAYCGIRGGNGDVERYRMNDSEIVACARLARTSGYGTVVLQSGEDAAYTCERMTAITRRIKAETRVAVTLSLGERAPGELSQWRDAGADRYLLRFEASNPALYRQIHPPKPGGGLDRLELLRLIRLLGYETGSGVMVGVPGQTMEDLANDIEWFARLQLHMVGVGPYVPHPGTPLASSPLAVAEAIADQVPATGLMTCKVLALTRLLLPYANLPSTTALATVDGEDGTAAGLRCGANVIMPNLTPPRYRRLYSIYPHKAGSTETPAQSAERVRRIVAAAGRTVGSGPGNSPGYKHTDRSSLTRLEEELEHVRTA